MDIFFFINLTTNRFFKSNTHPKAQILMQRGCINGDKQDVINMRFERLGIRKGEKTPECNELSIDGLERMSDKPVGSGLLKLNIKRMPLEVG